VSVAGNPLFLAEVAGGGQGAANARLVQPEPAAGNFTTLANFGTTTTTRWYRLTPAATVGPAGGDPASTPPTTGDNVGWNVSRADMDRPSGRPRKMFGGSVTFNVSVVWTDIDAVASAGTYQVRAHVFKRGTTGTLTLLGTGSVSIAATDVGVLEKSYSFTASVPETLFQPGETLHVEIWLRGRGTATGQQFQFRTGNSATDVKITLPGAGLVHQTAIKGITRDSTGAPLPSATVKVFRQDTDAKVNEQTSTAAGVYEYLTDSTDTAAHYVVAHKATAPEIHGVSDRGLVAVE
jgi:hypothetical protein